ncbi:uncharacterized protein LOC142587225 [Dermacentor variabilis]|uniref:uncharacterized protein LOC142587225 n=1 Tax=Dermacentor variabilis TaxID=34621 RepID=UPI003F5C15CB
MPPKNQAKKASPAKNSKEQPASSSRRGSASSKSSPSTENTAPAQPQGRQQPAASAPAWVQQYQQQQPAGYQGPMWNQIPVGYQDPMGQMQGQAYVDPADPNTVHYEGFDAGARFTNLAPARVPPPPPGVMPNPAQVALMQGRNVVVTQRKSNVFSGGSSGGVDTGCTLQ